MNHDEKATYKDLSFMVSFYDIVDHSAFFKLCECLTIMIDFAWLESVFDGIIKGQGDVLLFPSLSDEQSLLYLDLFQSPTDQNEMIEIGIRCHVSIWDQIVKYAELLYQEAPVKSRNFLQGMGMITDKIQLEHYPVRLPTITKIDEIEEYEYIQKLIVVT